MKRIDYYKTNDGKCPFKEWLNSLSIEYQMRIRKRLDRIYEGNFGDWGQIQNSKLFDMRFFFCKGYRVYYKELDDVVVLIVAGSDKSNQDKIIQQANSFFDDYINRRTK